MFYIATKDGLVVNFPGNKTYQVSKDHVNFDKIFKLVTTDSNVVPETIDELVNIKKSLLKEEVGGIVFSINENDELEVSIDGVLTKVLDSALENRLLEMIRAQDDDAELRAATFKSFAKFIRNLYNNPSYHSIKQLFGFLNANDLPITQNGTFLAYKKIDHDYFDIHSHSFDNSIGKEVSMPRYQVEDNPEVTCSSGLHVCSYSYLSCYSSSTLDRVVICEVNPADVVSVPYDYNNAKMRVCKYKVVDEVPTHFEAKLASYVYGDHEEGWIKKTFDALYKFYSNFFKSENIIDSNPDTITVTSAVVDAFFDSFEKEVGQKLPDVYIQNCKDYEVLPKLLEVFGELSKHDSNWVYKSVDGSVKVDHGTADEVSEPNDTDYSDDYYDDSDDYSDDDYDNDDSEYDDEDNAE